MGCFGYFLCPGVHVWMKGFVQISYIHVIISLLLCYVALLLEAFGGYGMNATTQDL